MRRARSGVLAIALAWFAGCGGSSKSENASGGASAAGGVGGTSAGSLGAGRGSDGGAGGIGATGGASGSAQGGGAGTSGSGGASAGTSGGGSSGTGGSGGEGAVSSSGSGGESGESGEAGAPALGGSSGMSSSVGGQGPAPGFPCFGDALCDTGKRCVACETSGTYRSLCVPDPDEDASGYAAATTECTTILRYVDCDGPEDCAEDEYCAWVMGGLGAHCVTEAELPDPVTATCCFECSALPVCTLCWNDADCPATQVCVAQAGSPRNVGRCRLPE